ncbi:hypothetical protein L3067_01255 [Xanthomonas sp. PPL568]|uniref:hypothetical protein n=1 Tax=Xanthomonas indica TaxID=2912242 RepID=UPI001F5823E4|nr:hypothetical protein [Xanthomonas indica]MCI2243236.1 hypothetical protein [Xanthomonas indica]
MSTTTLTPEALQRAMAAACKAGKYARIPNRVYDALIAGWEELRTAPTAPGVAAADLYLAAQMLTWGREDGLTEQQQKDIEAHQRKLFAALGSAGTQPQAEQHGVPELFVQWLEREMPAGTVIGRPAWWAPKLVRALRNAERGVLGGCNG